MKIMSTSGRGSIKALRMFRNYWFYNPANFELFKELVEQSSPECQMGFPKKETCFQKSL